MTVDSCFVFVAQSLSCSVVSDFLWPHGLQHARLSCPSPTPRVYSNSCPLSQWCHPTISSSVAPFSSCPQSFPASEFLQWVSSSRQVAKISELQLPHQSFQWVSGLISFRIIWFDLLTVQVTLKSLLQHHSLKASIIWHSAFFMVQLPNLYMSATLEYLILISLCCVLRLSHFSKLVPFFFPPVSKAKSSMEYLAFEWHTAD